MENNCLKMLTVITCYPVPMHIPWSTYWHIRASAWVWKMRDNHFGKWLTVSYKVKCVLIIWPSNSTSRYSFQGNKNICPQTELLQDIRNSSKLETTKMSSSRKMNKQIVLYNRTSPNNKKQWTICSNKDKGWTQ